MAITAAACLLTLAIFLFLPAFLALPLTAIIWLLAFMSLVFFRDPEREIGEGITSPADGKVSSIEKTGNGLRISIFMNVHNVHVNRSPSDGEIVSILHIPGKHLPAFDKDSSRNERVITRMSTTHGQMEITQIAGAFARRIVPYVKEGQKMKKGERIGLIRFGSRVDICLPPNSKVEVKKGDKVLAGVTTFARGER
ncbi:MAG: phosphatidylserine decarboxylase [Candidatus Thermoplasmatota archaeon]|nr:phosphatidylserine decarboxylase [Candidatus Thermoplasmatota archaeon]